MTFLIAFAQWQTWQDTARMKRQGKERLEWLSDDSIMAHGIGNAIVLNVRGYILYRAFQSLHAVSHGHTVDDILQHGQIVGAVAKSVAMLQRDLEPVLQKLDSSCLGKTLGNDFSKSISPVDECEIPGDVLIKCVEITPGIFPDHQFVEYQIRPIPGMRDVKVFPAETSLDPCQIAECRPAVVEKHAVCAFKHGGDIAGSENGYDLQTGVMGDGVGKHYLVMQTDMCAASAHISIESNIAHVIRDIEIRSSSVDESEMALLSGILQRPARTVWKDVAALCDEGAIDIKK